MKAYDDGQAQIYHGDVLAVLRELPEESVNCVVTSPPYWGLRDYGTATWDGGSDDCDHRQGRPGSGRADGVVDERGQRNRDGAGAMGGDCGKCGARRIDRQLGLEATPEEYVCRMVEVFREVRRVLRDDGTVWLNIGDSYASNNRSGRDESPGVGATQAMTPTRTAVKWHAGDGSKFRWTLPGGQKPKDLVGIPWMLAFALRADGWYLRSDIIWAKPNPMPESVTDRPTKAHEYLFLLSKRERYWYDADAIREPAQNRPFDPSAKVERDPTGMIMGAAHNYAPGASGFGNNPEGRNKRTVWNIATEPYPEAHFATFPTALVTPPILAGCPEGGTVMDCFAGSGTTLQVAKSLGRKAIGIELNAEYIELAKRRIAQMGLL